MKKSRFVVLAGSMAAVFLAWVFLSHDDDDILQVRDITGTITEIYDKPRVPNNQTNPRRQTPPRLIIGVVELDEGGHARILIPRGKFEVGTEINLTMTLYKNGDRKVVPKYLPTENDPSLQNSDEPLSNDRTDPR